MEDKEAEFIRLVSLITPKQKAFADSYLICLNAAQAARNIGVCAKSASTSAHKFLRNSNVRAYIDFHLIEAGLTNLETIKSVSDISRASVNDYFKVERKVIGVKVPVTYADKITKLREDLEDLDAEPGMMAELGVVFDEYETDRHEVKRNNLLREIALLTIKHKRNPGGFEWETVLEERETAELDIARLVQDKTAGKIKTFSIKENGEMRIEMYDSLAALQMLLRVQGQFEKDNKQKVPDTEIKVTVKKAEYTDDEFL